MPGTLHVTNGESVSLNRSGLEGEVICWNDVLHEGPVPAGLTLEQMSIVRAKFLTSLASEEESALYQGFLRRDRALGEFRNREEVVLWFEHDLFDQLQLIQILDWFSRQELGQTKLTLISVDTYLGRLEPGQLVTLYPARRSVSEAELRLGSRAWRDFCSPAPTALAQLIREDTSALPFLRGCLLRHLKQFPSLANGLSRTERQILEIAASGVSRVSHLFRADQRKEERIFMGDCVFYAYVRGLAGARVPLLRFVNGTTSFQDAEVRITTEAKAVLSGKADHVRLNGIDRWLGGVHLRQAAVWRWDGEKQVAVSRL